MNTELIIAGVLVFFAAFVAAEALMIWWNSNHSSQAKRIAERLDALTDEVKITTDDSATELNRKRRAQVSPHSLEGRLAGAKGTGSLHRLLVESGTSWTVVGFVSFAFILSLAVFFVAQVLRFDAVVSGGLALAVGISPLWVVTFLRNQRRKRFQEQLPTALDMISRALRAGHSFSSALNVAGSEMSAPLGPELKTAYNEINFGIAPNTALENLARRVPSTDLGYFVIAVIIQRETGGNLTEVMDNISSVIRERLKLFGKVRAISAEGKYSAIVLSILPFITAWLFYAINPDLMSLLWTDPSGISMIYMAFGMITVGILWMRKVIKIHV